MKRWEQGQHRREGDRVYRFGRTERLVHWMNAFAFFALVATGVLLLFRSTFLLTEPQVAFLRQWHFYIGAFYWIVPGAFFLLGDARGFLNWWLEAFSWSSSEALWLMGPMRPLIFPRSREPEPGRFNAGQRMNMLGQIAMKPALGITGVVIYFKMGLLLPFILHLGGSIMLAGLVAGHIYMSVLNASTRESATAMIDGYIRAEFVAHHHPAWYRAIPVKDPAAKPSPAPKESRSVAPAAVPEEES